MADSKLVLIDGARTCYYSLFLTCISRHCKQAKVCGRSDQTLFKLTTTRLIVSSDTARLSVSLTQMGSDPHDVSISVLAMVREERQAIEWATHNHDAEYSSTFRVCHSSFMSASHSSAWHKLFCICLRCLDEICHSIISCTKLFTWLTW